MKEKKEYTAKEIKSLQTKLNDLKEKHGEFSTKLEQDKINSFNLPIEEPINYYDGFNTGFDTDSSPFVWEHYRKY